MHASRILKFALLIPLAAVAFVALFGWVVMLLWNHVLTTVVPVGAVTFWQAIGITVLCKILFGGIPGKGGHCRPNHGCCSSDKSCCCDDEHGERWASLSEDERREMRAEMKLRFGSWPRPSAGGKDDTTKPGSTQPGG